MIEFSVIIPTWNRAAFIQRSVSSCLNQHTISPETIEIWVIDDGSTDDTEALVNAIKTESKIHYIKLPHYGLPGVVRNVGLEKSTGKYIAFCDSDDFWLPHHLATAKVEFKRDPTLSMVQTYWGFAKFTVKPDGSIQNDYEVTPHPMTVVNTNCRIITKQVTDWVGWFNEERWGEDGDYFDRISNGYNTIKVPIITNINGYIKGGNNISYEFIAKEMRDKYV